MKLHHAWRVQVVITTLLTGTWRNTHQSRLSKEGASVIIVARHVQSFFLFVPSPDYLVSTMMEDASRADDRKRSALREQDLGDDTAKRQKSAPPGLLRKLTNRDGIRKSCEIHRTIDLCPVAKVLMDTAAFQRLRHVKQLGTSDFVYDSANHTRFEHSLGVMHLANTLCRRIMDFQPHLETTNKDVLCVTLAGLLHDIGHGPFSHVYEDFRKDIAKDVEDDASKGEAYGIFQPVDNEGCDNEGWTHENSSLVMIDASLEQLGLAIDWQNLDKPLKQIGYGSKCVDARSMRVFKHVESGSYDDDDDDDDIDELSVLTSRDFIFIKECIWSGKPLKETHTMIGRSKLVGRIDPKKQWLYEIVANRFSGLDVDKVDYFARDQRRALGEAGLISIMLSEEARVAKASCHLVDCCECAKWGKGHYRICYPEKAVAAVMEFFKFRDTMHRKVYQHKTTVAASYLVRDILRKADLHYLMTDRKGSKPLPISRAFLNPDVYLQLKDSILDVIQSSTCDELAEARGLADRFFERDLYKWAGEKVVDMNDPEEAAIWKKEESVILDEILAIPGKRDAKNGESIRLTKTDVIVNKSCVHWGCKDKNPLTRMRFFVRNAHGPDVEAVEMDPRKYPTMTPCAFQTNTIRVYCRDPDPAKVDLLAHVFNAWKLQEFVFATPANDVEHLQHEEFDTGEMDDDDDGFGGGDGFGGSGNSRLLTQEDPEEQESDDDDPGITTPHKPQRDYKMDPSPIPLRR